MNERKSFQNGITLIALVISIIVMLILAGVSLNATIGDNGIITQAQNATYMQSIAALEEYLQTEYVKYYDETENYTSKIELLSSKLGNLCLKDGTKNYITYDGKMYYLINKQALPDDVKNQLKGGDTTEYLKYIRLQDVYGVTPDLKVYYCESGTDNALGTLDSTELDPSTPLKKINQDAEMKSAVTEALASVGVTVGENGITVGDAAKIKNIELDGSKYNITSISGLSELSSLKTVTLSNLNLNDLDGLQNCTLLYYVYFKNCKVNDYSKLATVLDLQYLYLYLPPSMNEADANAQVNNLGNGLANATELNKLEYFGISGNTDMIEGKYSINAGSVYSKWSYNESSKSNLTDISSFNKFPTSIKNTIKYVYINNNSFSSIENLKDFSNIYELDLMYNSNLLNLNGLENNSKLTYIFAQNCDLQNITGILGSTNLSGLNVASNKKLNSLKGIENSKNIDRINVEKCNIEDITALQDNIKIRYLDITNNTSLKSVIALKNCTGIRKLYLAGNINMIGTEVRDALADTTTHVLQNCGGNYSLPSKYNIYFSTLTSYDYSNLGLTDDSDEINSLKNKTTVTRLNLSGNPNLSNIKLQEILSTMTGLKALNLNGCKNLNSIDFIDENKVANLLELDLRNTNSTLIDLSNLNNYATNLATLVVDNSSIELNKIQTTINRISRENLEQIKESWFNNGNYWDARGMVLCGDLSLYSFKNCNEITRYRTYFSWVNSMTGTLDLTDCSNLTVYETWSHNITCKLPKSLKYYYGYGNNIADLSECENLIYYHKDNSANVTKDMKTLSALAKLQNIDLYRDTVSDLNFLSLINNSNLVGISISGNGSSYQPSVIENLNGIENAKSLTNLNIGAGIKLTDVSAISKCENLNSLTILDCPNLEKVIGLQKLTKISKINLSNCKINTLDGIENLVNIESLNLSNNRISDISFLKNMKKLSGSVYLNDNNINDLKDLENTIYNGKVSYTYLNLNNNILQTTSINGNNNINTLKKLYNAGLRNLETKGNNFTAGSTDELKSLKWDFYKE